MVFYLFYRISGLFTGPNCTLVVACEIITWSFITQLLWRHNGRDGVSNHQPHDCLLNRLFTRRSKKTSKLRVTGLCAGKSSVTGEFPAQMASNAEKCFHSMTSSWLYHCLRSNWLSPAAIYTRALFVIGLAYILFRWLPLLFKSMRHFSQYSNYFIHLIWVALYTRLSYWGPNKSLWVGLRICDKPSPGLWWLRSL